MEAGNLFICDIFPTCQRLVRVPCNCITLAELCESPFISHHSHIYTTHILKCTLHILKTQRFEESLYNELAFRSVHDIDCELFMCMWSIIKVGYTVYTVTLGCKDNVPVTLDDEDTLLKKETCLL